jgi:hypothetical protein
VADLLKFSKEATQAQLDKLKDIPDDAAEVGAVVTPGMNGLDVGVKGSISQDLGKPGGWAFIAEGSWMKKAGGSVAAMLRRKGK